MNSVDEINVGMPGRPEEHRVSRSAACGGVGSGIAGPEIGFHFNNASREEFAPGGADDDFAQQFAPNLARITIEEFPSDETCPGNVNLCCCLPLRFSAQ